MTVFPTSPLSLQQKRCPIILIESEVRGTRSFSRIISQKTHVKMTQFSVNLWIKVKIGSMIKCIHGLSCLLIIIDIEFLCRSSKGK